MHQDTAQIHAKFIAMSEQEMEMDEGDDLYEPEEPKVEIEDDKKPPSKSEELEEGEEEDESGAMDEDDDESVRISRFRSCRASLIIVAQDVDIITERKDGSKAAPPPYVFESRFDHTCLDHVQRTDRCACRQSKYSDIRNIPQRSTSTDTPVKPAPAKKEEESRASTGAANVAAPSADQTSAAASKSTIDINTNPVYPAAGKPITQVNIDEGRSAAKSSGQLWPVC